MVLLINIITYPSFGQTDNMVVLDAIAPEPSCWSATSALCDTKNDFAPDSLFPEHTPVKYVKIVLHVFQTDDPNNPGNWVEENPAHLAAINAWFNNPAYGINAQLSNLCDPLPKVPGNWSPHIPDARIQLYNTGTVGEDLFFWEDYEGWRTGYFCGSCTSCGWVGGQINYMYDNYVEPFNDPNNPLYAPDTYNAMHVFLTGATDPPPHLDTYPPCIWYCTTGATYMFTNHGGGASCGNKPSRYFVSGTYYSWLAATSNQPQEIEQCISTYGPNPDPASLFGSSELLHILTVDHPGTNAHITGGDQCGDTPTNTVNNLMDTPLSPPDKCSLTRCQLGRAHHFIHKNNPVYMRTPDNGFAYPPTNECNITEADIIVPNGANVFWKSPRRLRSNVIIEPGGHLHIQCEVGMPELAKITVEAGGQLTIEEAGMITSNCNDTWKGIEIIGNPNLPQSALTHGFVWAKSGAIIENAENSLKVFDGGMVWAIGATFRNCGGANFYYYPRPNTGRFIGCDFIHDNFNPVTATTYHAALLGVRNIQFSACDFRNLNNNSPFKPYGITSLGSGFTVSVNSTFEGFDVAIGANNSFGTSLGNFSVLHSDFRNNKTGIQAIGVQNYTVLHNEFQLEGADYNLSGQVVSGIMMENCSGYRIEQNRFIGDENGSAFQFGTLTQDSGDEGNFINGNRYEDLYVANLAQGDNTGKLAGLQYLCNFNDANTLRDFNVSRLGDGIWISQGNGRAARDTFSLIDGNSSDYFNGVGKINYYHRDNTIETPESFSGIQPIIISNPNICPQDGNFNGVITEPVKQEAREKFAEASLAYQTEKAAYEELIDGGNTDSLLTLIENGDRNNNEQIRQFLLSLSPYLSAAVLEAVTDRDDIFTDSIQSEIFIANPDELRRQSIRDLVEVEFSPTMALEILSNDSVQTQRTEKINLVSTHLTDLHWNANLLIAGILQDTTGTDVDSMRYWLAGKQSIEADYAVVLTYLGDGDSVKAFQLLNQIPSNYDFTELQSVEHIYFTDLASFWLDLLESNTAITDLDSAQVAFLENIADNSVRQAGAIARGILNTAYGYYYRVIPEDPEAPQPLILPPGNAVKPAVFPATLSAYPNPAKNSITFAWRLAEESETAEIAITDMKGSLVAKIPVSGKRGKIVWNTGNLEPGVYSYRLMANQGNLATAKLVIIR